MVAVVAPLGVWAVALSFQFWQFAPAVMGFSQRVQVLAVFVSGGFVAAHRLVACVVVGFADEVAAFRIVFVIVLAAASVAFVPLVGGHVTRT